MKFTFLLISLIFFALGILGILGLVPKFIFPSEDLSLTAMLLIAAILGMTYSFINPLLMAYERAIIILLVCIILISNLYPFLSSIITIKLNMTVLVRSLIAIIRGVVGMLYSIFAPG